MIGNEQLMTVYEAMANGARMNEAIGEFADERVYVIVDQEKNVYEATFSNAIADRMRATLQNDHYFIGNRQFEVFEPTLEMLMGGRLSETARLEPFSAITATMLLERDVLRVVN